MGVTEARDNLSAFNLQNRSGGVAAGSDVVLGPDGFDSLADDTDTA